MAWINDMLGAPPSDLRNFKFLSRREVERWRCIAVGLSRNFSALSERTDRRSVMKTNSSAAERKGCEGGRSLIANYKGWYKFHQKTLENVSLLHCGFKVARQ